jgi:hypothetical protein
MSNCGGLDSYLADTCILNKAIWQRIASDIRVYRVSVQSDGFGKLGWAEPIHRASAFD